MKENKLIVSIDAPVPLNKCEHPVLTKGGKQDYSTWTKIEGIVPKCDRKCLPQNNDQYALTAKPESHPITGRRSG